MPLNKTNVYEQDERGLSSAHAQRVLGPAVKQMTGCQWGCPDVQAAIWELSQT